MKIRLAGITEESCVDGPGLRFVVFVQGCHRACQGCHNPSTWDINDGVAHEVDEISNKIISKADLIDGVTLSGGEPFLQVEPCLQLVKILKEKCPQLSIVVYSGYTLDELLISKEARQLLDLCDLLVDGPFIEDQRAELPFRGSANQRIVDLKKSLTFNKVVLFMH